MLISIDLASGYPIPSSTQRRTHRASRPHTHPFALFVDMSTAASRIDSATAENDRREPSGPNATQSRPGQLSPTPPASISTPSATKRKYGQESEAEAEADQPEDARPPKQRRKSSPSRLALSEENLQSLNRSMNVAAGNSQPGSIKRSWSQFSSSTQATKSSSSTNAHYRFKILQPAQLNLHVDPPTHIQDTISAVAHAKPPEGRREQLLPIAQKFQARCVETVRASVGENDFVKIFHDMLDLMGYSKLCLRTNADWDAQLKPSIQHSRFNVGSLRPKAGDRQQQRDDALLPPSPANEQPATDQQHMPTQSSTANEPNPPPANGPQCASEMPPPAVPGLQRAIKTPRPDITMGIALTALYSALSSQDLEELEAEIFLTELQRETESGEPDGREEPMLISVPAPRASDLAFPFGVDEGKAYLTGQPLCAAENQAAVSGACALRMQLRLDELGRRNMIVPTASHIPTRSDGLPASSRSPKLPLPSEDQIPLFFSICTEGPIHVLWAHWTEAKRGTRQFNMMPLKCVYGVLSDGLLDFFVMVDNVLRWGTGHFLESLAVRLGKLARKAGPAT
jgi:hypothetical protein